MTATGASLVCLIVVSKLPMHFPVYLIADLTLQDIFILKDMQQIAVKGFCFEVFEVSVV
jgi:hypothetical protein